MERKKVTNALVISVVVGIVSSIVTGFLFLKNMTKLIDFINDHYVVNEEYLF